MMEGSNMDTLQVGDEVDVESFMNISSAVACLITLAGPFGGHLKSRQPAKLLAEP